MSARIRRHHRRVVDQLDALLELARDPAALEATDEQVSHWTVAQHLEHLALVDAGILKILEQAEPSTDLAGQGPSPGGRILLVLGFIPRGRAKAPSFVEPREVVLDEIEGKVERARQRFADLDLDRLAGSEPLARHHRFGCLNGTRWLRFVGIHHHHHGKIVRDIQRAARFPERSSWRSNRITRRAAGPSQSCRTRDTTRVAANR